MSQLRHIRMTLESAAERDAIQTALKDPDVLAFVKTVGFFGPLSEQQKRTLQRFVKALFRDWTKR